MPSPTTTPLTHPRACPDQPARLDGLRATTPPAGRDGPDETSDPDLDRPLLKTAARSGVTGCPSGGSDEPILPSWWAKPKAAAAASGSWTAPPPGSAVNYLHSGRGPVVACPGRLDHRGPVPALRSPRWSCTPPAAKPGRHHRPADPEDAPVGGGTPQARRRGRGRGRLPVSVSPGRLSLTGSGPVVVVGAWLSAAALAAAPPAGYVGLLRAGLCRRWRKPLRHHPREHVVPDLTIEIIANTLAQVVGGSTGKAILDNPHNVIQEGIVRGDALVFRCCCPARPRRPGSCSTSSGSPPAWAGRSTARSWSCCRSVGGALRPVGVRPARPRRGPPPRAAVQGPPQVVVGADRRRGAPAPRQPTPSRLHGGAWFVGGKPESGKSTLAIIAAAHTVLDPFAHLILVNLKGSPDYAWCKKVAHKYISDSPETRPQVVREVHALVAWLLEECGRRNEFLSRLVERGEVTGSAVTEDLARKYPELRPLTVILDEIHRMFDESDNPDHEAFADLLAKVLKAVRSVAITVICVTQLAGTESVPPVVTRAARVRACLRVSEASSMRQILGDLGQGAFERFGLAGFPSGTAMLTTDEGSPVKVGGWYLAPHLAETGARAHKLRTDLDLLTGEAAGQTVDTGEPIDPADLLRHLLPVIGSTAPAGGPEDAGVAWLSELETVLTERAEYRDRAPGWLVGELRSRGVRTVDVGRRRGYEDRPSGQRKEIGVTVQSIRDRLDVMLDAAA